MNSDRLLLIPASLGLVAFVWILRKRLLVRARGVEVDARCYDREWRGQGGGPTFLLSFRTADGIKMTCSATESEVSPGTRTGGTVKVRYDPAAPGRVETVITSRRPLWKRGDLIGLVVFEAAVLAYILG
ncbi:DUF3592 domain-containing protein [Streptomyces lividans]|uniref:Membrane protein n=2 Tax=Streptomyces lividans TaxID=1916 RepID=A0A7U9HBC8_STRLI|nr:MULTISPECIES: DUF3592 domain-containing protein [Streptomyces]QSJ11163.1 membrane protein [Streptomyces lividans]AIJ15587.1 membrane protein [Streptomyces lividans TK24]EFD69020.1 membrane protein [Streptomyces lividans TK24]EOY47934.1 membrane protein [Streptomyces lividans 1326]KKD10291.1 membrane protein [Streptomyces sp. WM6391]